MADYTPLYVTAAEATFSATTSAAVTGGQVLAVSATGTVGPAGASSGAVVGVAAHDAASGARVTVHRMAATHVLTAAGAITAGDQVVTGAAGTVASLAVASGTPDAAAVNSARAVIGVALTTAADAASVQINGR